MIELPIYDSNGKKVDTIKVDPQVLGGEVRYSLLKQAYVITHGNQRQGSARTKSRGDVEGSTRKLYKQKGTGNARAGAARTPIRKGGGVTFKKTRDREDFRTALPKKMRRLANRNALLAKLVDNEVKCFAALDFKAPKTAEFAKMMAAVGIDRTCLVQPTSPIATRCCRPATSPASTSAASTSSTPSSSSITATSWSTRPR